MTGDAHDTKAAQALHELRLLAQALVNRVEPALRNAAENQAEGPYPHTGCEWCPVCATVALLRGENHELLAFLAGHGATLVALLRQFVEQGADHPGGGAADHDGVAARFAEIVRQFSAFAGGHGDPADPVADNGGMDHDEPAARRRPRHFESIPVVVKR